MHKLPFLHNNIALVRAVLLLLVTIFQTTICIGQGQFANQLEGRSHGAYQYGSEHRNLQGSNVAANNPSGLCEQDLLNQLELRLGH